MQLVSYVNSVQRDDNPSIRAVSNAENMYKRELAVRSTFQAVNSDDVQETNSERLYPGH